MDEALAPLSALSRSNARRFPCRAFAAIIYSISCMIRRREPDGEKESPAPFDPLILQLRHRYPSTALDEVYW